VAGTDGSETADDAVRHAVELARAARASVELVSAYEPVSPQRLREEVMEIPADVAQSVGPREQVNVILDEAAGVADAAGVKVRIYAREGIPPARSSTSPRRRGRT
jgi:nucleotide-binding universal stress UspA family protein